MADAYQTAAKSLTEQASKKLKDGQLASEVAFHGRTLPMATVLSGLIRHQIHHRGQTTILMRQAGVVVPGVYGHSRKLRRYGQSSKGSKAKDFFHLSVDKFTRGRLVVLATRLLPHVQPQFAHRLDPSPRSRPQSLGGGGEPRLAQRESTS